jgi:hypothetical protein
MSFRLKLNAVKRNGEILYSNKLFRMEDFSTTLEMTILFQFQITFFNPTYFSENESENPC